MREPASNLPVERDEERFKTYSADPRPTLPAGYEAPLGRVTTREAIGRRLRRT